MSKIPTAEEYFLENKNMVLNKSDAKMIKDFTYMRIQALKEEIKDKAKIDYIVLGQAKIDKSSIDTITENYLKENQL